MNRNCCDVLIVGGGPAGLAAAIALRMEGVDVVLADSLKPPIDKACGEGLMPDARRDLEILGVGCEAAEGRTFRGIRFVNWTGGAPVEASAEFARDEGLGVRRTVLHERLVARAQEIGVRLRWSTHVGLGSSVRLGGEPCRYGHLVGADGQSSRVRHWAGLDRGRLISKRFGFRRHYRVAPLSRYIEVHWSDLGQVYITPLGEQEICVAAVTRFPSTRMQPIVDSIPALRERLRSADAITQERGALTTTRRLEHVVSGNVALVGDASGSVDAVTGEGLAIGFRQAQLLRRALRKGSLDFYQAEHETSLRMPRRMARILLMMDAHPHLRDVAMRALAESSGLFGRFLKLHLGEEKLPGFLLENGAAILKRLAIAALAVSETERAPL